MTSPTTPQFVMATQDKLSKVDSLMETVKSFSRGFEELKQNMVGQIHFFIKLVHDMIDVVVGFESIGMPLDSHAVEHKVIDLFHSFSLPDAVLYQGADMDDVRKSLKCLFIRCKSFVQNTVYLTESFLLRDDTVIKPSSELIDLWNAWSYEKLDAYLGLNLP